jgi:hypothetical protein
MARMLNSSAAVEIPLIDPAGLRRVANSDVVDARPSSRITLLMATLITLQVLDGALTFTGMHTFGLDAEGNPFLRTLMELLGLLPALLITKGVCIGIVIALYQQVTRISWLGHALGGIAAVYTFAAVIPWSYLLLAELLG